MEKTLSLGAFEELSENEVMVTEGGSILVAVAVGIGISAAGAVCGYGIGFANKVVGTINNITGSFVPAGTPNPNYIWKVF